MASPAVRQPQSYRPIDLRPVVKIIEERAVAALNDTLDFTLARAQHYAPVRAIFRGQRENRAFRGPIRTAAQFERFRAAQPPTHQISRPSKVSLADIRKLYRADVLDSGLDLLARGKRYRGGNNSELPVFRIRNVTIAGDLRQVSGGRLVPVAYLRQIKGGKINLDAPPEIGNGQTSIAGLSLFGRKSGGRGSMLSARGRYEVKTGRAVFRRAGTDRVGGSLKHSIRKIEASLSERSRGKIWGYVRAGNEDVDYARYQEIGTVHNRAHPYLRPALYESRGVFKSKIVQAFRSARFRRGR